MSVGMCVGDESGKRRAGSIGGERTGFMQHKTCCNMWLVPVALWVIARLHAHGQAWMPATCDGATRLCSELEIRLVNGSYTYSLEIGVRYYLGFSLSAMPTRHCIPFGRRINVTRTLDTTPSGQIKALGRVLYTTSTTSSLVPARDDLGSQAHVHPRRVVSRPPCLLVGAAQPAPRLAPFLRLRSFSTSPGAPSEWTGVRAGQIQPLVIAPHETHELQHEQRPRTVRCACAGRFLRKLPYRPWML